MVQMQVASPLAHGGCSGVGGLGRDLEILAGLAVMRHYLVKLELLILLFDLLGLLDIVMLHLLCVETVSLKVSHGIRMGSALDVVLNQAHHRFSTGGVKALLGTCVNRGQHARIAIERVRSN